MRLQLFRGVVNFDQPMLESCATKIPHVAALAWIGELGLGGELMEVKGIVSELRLELEQIEQAIFLLERFERPISWPKGTSTDQNRPSNASVWASRSHMAWPPPHPFVGKSRPHFET